MQIFDIKKKKKYLNDNNKIMLEKYNKISNFTKDKALNYFNSRNEGLTNEDALKKLKEHGPNVVIKDDKKTWKYFLLNSFKDQFIIILLVLAVINFSLGDKLGSIIIVLIAVISAVIRFIQDYSVYKFNRKLKASIYSNATVLRNKKEIIIKTEKVVEGDIVKLNAGSIIPADLMILDSKDLFINESVFTGESIPVEKKTTKNKSTNIFDIDNICLMGSSVITGSATAIVIGTGFNSYLGSMGKEIDNKKEVTNFDKGMKNITKMLITYMIVVCLVVLVVDGVIKGNFKEAILFALSVAVGITPSMLPMIVNVNLTKGSKTLAKKKTLVKKIDAIQNLGAIDVLCTDKTGTLTENNITLQKYIDTSGMENIKVLDYAFLNSYFSTGMKNIVDKAVLSYAKENKIDNIKDKYEKIDEIPFDYNRKKTSIVVKNKDKYKMITKGALEEVIKSCSSAKINDKNEKLTQNTIDIVNKKARELEEKGMQVIALAEKNEYKGKDIFSINDEKEMTLIGFVGFLDPPKKDVKNVLLKLKNAGISLKVITGDNMYATENICKTVGINSDKVLIGADIDKLTDEELSSMIDDVNIYARFNPLQKERIIRLFKEKEHVVGYMGDGVNDAPSLHTADVGISVNSATDIAKEASDIILLEKSLKVIYDGVIEGRKVYANIIKYMKMALSGDFGDVFSIMIASIFLPFLPLLPIQMLLQDFIYDFSQIGIPYDNVDEEFLRKPKKWNTKGISRFMKVMGITSSIIDCIAFIIFWFVLGYNSVNKQAYFQTAWFVMCLISELMIIHNVRTSKKAFIESRASKTLTLLTLLSLILTIITPILFYKVSSFNFVILPLRYYLYVILLVILYMILVNIIKKIYIKKNGEWL
ncbi:MAG: magnesium-translocating P-type ATPase [Tenericutes bacterium]|nr:magnesium-translocating P-type ATPase [Mycoplasmatota bacterium]